MRNIFPGFRAHLAWALLAVAALAGWAWAARYQYPQCVRMTCLRVNRWTGAPAIVAFDGVHTYRPAASSTAAAAARPSPPPAEVDTGAMDANRWRKYAAPRDSGSAP